LELLFAAALNWRSVVLQERKQKLPTRKSLQFKQERHDLSETMFGNHQHEWNNNRWKLSRVNQVQRNWQMSQSIHKGLWYKLSQQSKVGDGDRHKKLWDLQKKTNRSGCRQLNDGKPSVMPLRIMRKPLRIVWIPLRIVSKPLRIVWMVNGFRKHEKEVKEGKRIVMMIQMFSICEWDLSFE
jgi:hypothetical protein